MAKIKLHNLEGKKIKDIEVSDAVFGLPANDALVHQVYVSLAANQRQVSADTKTRGERAGSGIKPWRQKGTGRARVGSVRTPTWRGGGVAFGPTNERNFKKKINKKMNAKAIATVLSGKLRDGELIVLDTLKLKENKTKIMAQAFKNLQIKGRILLGFSETEKAARAASRNLTNVSNVLAQKLNVLEMLNHKNLMLSQDSLKYLEEKYLPAGKASQPKAAKPAKTENKKV